MKTKKCQPDAVIELVRALSDALAFYADVDTYFGIGIFPDLPCGNFINDFDATRKPGALARKTIKKYRAQISVVVKSKKK